MKAAQLEREIQVVEAIIAQLNECLGIFIKENYHKDIKRTLKDIQICKAELKKLIAAKEAEKEAENHDDTKRSGKAFSQ